MSNNIPNSKDNVSGLKEERNLLRHRSQGHQQHYDTLFFFLDAKRGDKKVWREKDNRNKRSHCEKKREVVEIREKIFKVSIYYHMIYK